MTSFTPVASLVGGMLIGLAAALLWIFNGRIAGVSGIAGRLIEQPRSGDVAWRLWFLGGLLAGGAIAAVVAPGAFAFEIDRSFVALAAAGIVVGIGTRLGSGCTSGHGVCGISRLSKRSIAATLAFVATGAVTVYVVEHAMGGTL